MVEPVLSFDAVDLARGRRIVLRGVTLHVAPGEAWLLIGPNGAGKSTLLAAALGGLRPRKGRIVRAPGLQSRRAVGFVPQRCTLDPTLPTTVSEFVELGLVGLGLARSDRRARTGAALATVGLDAHGPRPFWSHSEGQRQRILLARALARRPRYLLMDEPTASLDPAAAVRFWERVAGLRSEAELTVLCATHDLAAADRLATHAAVCVPGEGGGVVEPMVAGRLRGSGALDRAFGPGLGAPG